MPIDFKFKGGNKPVEEGPFSHEELSPSQMGQLDKGGRFSPGLDFAKKQAIRAGDPSTLKSVQKVERNKYVKGSGNVDDVHTNANVNLSIKHADEQAAARARAPIAKIADKVRGRIANEKPLEPVLGQFKCGGPVKKTGRYLVHKGERVLGKRFSGGRSGRR